MRIAAAGELFTGVKELTAWTDKVYFVAQDGDDGSLGWAQTERRDSDRGIIETKDAASFVTAAPPPSAEPPQEGPFSQLVVFREQLYLAVDEASTGTELWTSDGTATGTAPVLDVPDADLDPRDLVVVGDQLWFSAGADDGSGREPWLTDGTAAGTKLVADIAPEGASDPVGFISFRSHVAFTADDGVHGRELWLSDAGRDTKLVLDIRRGREGSEPHDFVVLGGSR